MFRRAATRITHLFIGIGFSLYIAIPMLVFAESLGKAIVPCAGALPSGNLPACNTCHIAELAQNVINTGILLVVMLAAILFAWAGVSYLTAYSYPVAANAKKLLGHVTIGLIIILGAWMVVDIIMKVFMGDQAGGLGPWNDVCRALPQIS